MSSIERNGTHAKAFAKLRVLDLSHVLAGPHCARQLADLGAEVIKIEQPGHGDSVRNIRSRPGRGGMVFANLNAGKRSLALDLTHPEGQAVMRDLVRCSDVLIENFRPGVMRRFGLDYAAVNALNPALVMCSISAFGQTGPLAEQGGFAYSAMAMSGALDLDRERDGKAHIGHLPVPDFLAALNALSAIGFALLQRTTTGKGQHIDISLVDCMLAGEDLAVSCVINGEDYTPQPRPTVSIHSVGDGQVVIMMTTPEIFGRFVTAIGRAELRTDPRFASRDARIAHQAEINAIIDDWIRSCATREEAVAFLSAHRVPAAAVLTLPEMMRHPQVVQRESLVNVPSRHDQGNVRVVRSALRLSAINNLPRRDAPPRIGSDSTDVLLNALGYDPARVDKLLAGGAVVQA